MFLCKSLLKIQIRICDTFNNFPSLDSASRISQKKKSDFLRLKLMIMWQFFSKLVANFVAFHFLFFCSENIHLLMFQQNPSLLFDTYLNTLLDMMQSMQAYSMCAFVRGRKGCAHNNRMHIQYHLQNTKCRSLVSDTTHMVYSNKLCMHIYYCYILHRAHTRCEARINRTILRLCTLDFANTGVVGI